MLRAAAPFELYQCINMSISNAMPDLPVSQWERGRLREIMASKVVPKINIYARNGHVFACENCKLPVWKGKNAMFSSPLGLLDHLTVHSDAGHLIEESQVRLLIGHLPLAVRELMGPELQKAWGMK